VIDWESIGTAMDRQHDLAKLPSDVLASELQRAEDELAGAWVPAAIDAGTLAAGDVIVGKDQHLWTVTDLTDPRDAHGAPLGEHVRVHLAGTDKTWRLARDYRVKVLVPYPEREALILARRELGAQIIRRNTTGSGS
jgi:hypothetical protein